MVDCWGLDEGMVYIGEVGARELVLEVRQASKIVYRDSGCCDECLLHTEGRWKEGKLPHRRR